MPNQIPKNLPNHLSEEVKQDLLIAQVLCEKVKRATFLREQKKDTINDQAVANDRKKELAEISEYIIKATEPFIPYFTAYASSRVYTLHRYIDNESNDDEKRVEPEDNVSEVLQTFFEKRILQSSTFCNYEGKNNSRLLTYLYAALNFEILTYNEKVERIRKTEIPIDPIDPTGGRGEDGDNLHGTQGIEGCIPDPVKDKLDHLQTKNLITEIIDEAITKLTAIISDRDKIVFFNRKSGVDYNTLARGFLNAQGLSDSAAVAAEVVNVRQSYSRSTTKLNILITKMLNDRGLKIEYTEDGFSFFDLDESALSKQELLLNTITNTALLRMSENYPIEAFEVKKILKTQSFSQTILFFGKIGDTVCTPGKKGPLKIFQRYLDEVLDQKGISMTIERFLPLIKEKYSVTEK